MNKDKLKKDLINYINGLSEHKQDLDGYSYEDLYTMYLTILDIKPEEMKVEIASVIREYRQKYPELDLNEEQIIAETNLLEPINMVYVINKQIDKMKKEIIDLKSWIVIYKEQLEDDLADYEKSKINPDAFNNFRLAELPGDISHDRYVVNNYPRQINELEEKISAKQEIVKKIFAYQDTVNDHFGLGI